MHKDQTSEKLNLKFVVSDRKNWVTIFVEHEFLLIFFEELRRSAFIKEQ